MKVLSHNRHESSHSNGLASHINVPVHPNINMPVRPIINVPAIPQPLFDRITRMDRFFPVPGLGVPSAADPPLVDAFRNLTFEEKALMSSATIERNELYHEVRCKLRKLESEVVNKVIRDGISLLKLRIKRYRAEAIVEGLLGLEEDACETEDGTGGNDNQEGDGTGGNHSQEGIDTVGPHA